MSALERRITAFGTSPDITVGLFGALLELRERPTVRLHTRLPDTLSLVTSNSSRICLIATKPTTI